MEHRICGWEQRVFTADTGRYRQGDVKEYPRTTWNDIARSVDMPLRAFTKPLAEIAQESSRPRRGRPPKMARV